MDSNFGVEFSSDNAHSGMLGAPNTTLFVDHNSDNQFSNKFYETLGPKPETNSSLWSSIDGNNFINNSGKWDNADNSMKSHSSVENRRDSWSMNYPSYSESDKPSNRHAPYYVNPNNLHNPNGHEFNSRNNSHNHGTQHQNQNYHNHKRSSVPANPVSFKHPSYFPPSSTNPPNNPATNGNTNYGFSRDTHMPSTHSQTQSMQTMYSHAPGNPSALRPAPTLPHFPNNTFNNGSINSMGMSSNTSSTGPNNIPLAPTIQMQSLTNSILSVYEVQFKCHTHFYMVGSFPNSPSSVSVGDFVVVEADRGEDLGIVTEILSKEALIEKRMQTSKLYPFASSGVAGSTIGKIKRVANAHDQLLLPQKAFDEEHILQSVRDLAFHKYQFPLTLHDAVYQYDRHKLTFFYSSEVRIDFRDFVRELFGKYHTRIWMHEIHYANVPLIKFDNWANIALATGMKISS